MKFIIEKKELSLLTMMVHKAASNKNVVPVLSGLLLQVSHQNGITMTATDMEIGIKASSHRLEIMEEGTVLVNANYFADLIKVLPETSITIELDQLSSKLNIAYGRSSGHINTYREYEYPDLPLNNLQFKFSLPLEVLKEALKKTVFAAAANHFRQVFTGVLFDIMEGGLLRVVASDTHRLAMFSWDLEITELEPFRFIIPVRTVQEILRLPEDEPGDISVSMSENNVIFSRHDFLLLSRLIEGQYPNYQQVIPVNFNTTMNMNTKLLVNSLERAKTMPIDDKNKIPNVHFTLKGNEVLLHTYSEIMGEIIEIIEDMIIEGDPELQIAFNTNYFLDIARILDQECENLLIKFSGSLGPSLIKNPDKDNYIYVLVPLRTGN